MFFKAHFFPQKHIYTVQYASLMSAEAHILKTACAFLQLGLRDGLTVKLCFSMRIGDIFSIIYPQTLMSFLHVSASFQW